MLEVVSTLDAERAQQMPVFGTEEFLGAKSTEYGWFVSKQFTLPYFIDLRYHFRRLVFTTEVVATGGGVAEAEQAFLDEVVQACKARNGVNADFIAPAQANSVFRTAPSGSETIPWGSYVVDLGRPEEAIFAGYHPKNRNGIRKAQSIGVVIAPTEDVVLVQHVLKATMRRKKLLFYPSVEYLRELQRRLRHHITFYLATYQESVQGVAVIVHNQNGAFYYYGGSIESAFRGSQNLLQHEVILDLKRRGVPVYDLMGARIIIGDDTKIKGIQSFKSRFASGMRRGYLFRYLLKPTKYRVFLAAAKAYCTLKRAKYNGDVIDQTRPYRDARHRPGHAPDNTTPVLEASVAIADER